MSKQLMAWVSRARCGCITAVDMKRNGGDSKQEAWPPLSGWACKAHEGMTAHERCDAWKKEDASAHAALLAEVDALKAQREDLLKACKDAEQWFSGHGYNLESITTEGCLLIDLRAAIAAAEGEAKP